MKRMTKSARSTDVILSNLHSWIITEVANGDPSKNSVRSYMGSARAFLNWCSDHHVDPIEATEGEIKLYRSHLVQSTYRPSTISVRLAGLRHLFAAFLDWGWIEENPAHGIKARKDLTSRSEKVMAKYIPDRDLFLDLYKLPNVATRSGKRDRALLRLLCYAAVRVGELCSINIEDVLLDERPTLLVRAGKGRKIRHIPLGKEDDQIIDEWLLERQSISLVHPAALFVSLDRRTMGSRLSTRGARYIVDKYLRAAGIKKPGRSCHALRHSAATWLLDAGVPLQAIADILGHSSIDVTSIYARIVDYRKYTPGIIFKKELREALIWYR